MPGLEDLVAIPSYKRPDTLKNKTMKVLKHYKIDPKKIHIFVADTEQKAIYEAALDPKDYHKIIVGVPGIKNIRNFMPKYFEKDNIFFTLMMISQKYMIQKMTHVINQIKK